MKKSEGLGAIPGGRTDSLSDLTEEGKCLSARWRLRLLIATLFIACIPASAQVTLTSNDASNTSSFNSAGNWSNGLAPSASSDYSVTSATLRTPATTSDYAFAGNSLTIGTGGSLWFKSSGGTATITINSLTLAGGSIFNASSSAVSLAGHVTLQSGNSGNVTQDALDGGLNISASIGGSGSLHIQTDGSTQVPATSGTTLSGANTYSGGTVISNFANVVAGTDGAFGAGNVTVNGGKLTFQNGTTNQYIATTGELILSSSASSLVAGAINLNFSGTDTLAGILMNGVTLTAGSYTISQLNAEYDALFSSSTAAFTGSGVLVIAAVPEPGIMGSLTVGCLCLCFLPLRFHLLAISDEKKRKISL